MTTTFAPVEILSNLTPVKCPKSKNTPCAGATTVAIQIPPSSTHTFPPLFLSPLLLPLFPLLLHFIQPDLIHQWIMDGWMDGRLSSIKVLSLSLFLWVFLLRGGCSANAGQHALEMSPGTSHSVCLSTAWRIPLSVSLSVSGWSLTIPFSPFKSLFSNQPFFFCASFQHDHHIKQVKASGHHFSSSSSSNYLSAFSLLIISVRLVPDLGMVILGLYWPWPPLLPSLLIPLEASSKGQFHKPQSPSSYTAL